MKFRFYLIGAAVIAVLADFLLMGAGVYSISSDETSRTLISYYYFSRGIITATSWLPLHFLIIGSAFSFLQDLIIVPRLISLLFGILTIIVTARLTEEIFGTREIRIYSLLIILMLPQRVILSVVPLPEIIFFFFTVSSALFFLRWLKEGRVNDLLITAFMLSTANSLRYEAWVISFCFGMYTLFFVKGIKTRIFTLLILSLFPLFWLSYNYIRYNDLLFFLKEPENYYILAQEDSAFNRFIFNPLTQFAEQLAVTVSFAGLAGLYFLRKNPVLVKWVLVFFSPLILFSVFAITGKPLPAHNFWRTSAVWIILLVPFTSFILYKLRMAVRNYSLSWILLPLFFLQLVNSNIYYLSSVKKEYCLTKSKIETAREVINYVDHHAGKDDLVLIENVDTYEHFDITLASQEPLRFVFSKRNEIIPNEPEKYSNSRILYYLVKSPPLKVKMLLDNNYQKVLEDNGWMMFSRQQTITKR